MKVEIDTESASREELRHLAAMLHALSGDADKSFALPDTDGLVVPEPSVVHPPSTPSSPKNIFDDPAPSGGLFGMFGDPSPSQSSAHSQSSTLVRSSSEPVSEVLQAPVANVSEAPAQNAPVGDMFSIFGSDSSPSQVSDVSGVESYGTVPEADEKPTSADEIIDDDSIVPY